MKSLFSILISLFAFSPLTAFAEGKCEREFRQMAIGKVQAARANGWTQLNGIPLETLEAEMNTKAAVICADMNVTYNGRKNATFTHKNGVGAVHVNKLIVKDEARKSGITIHEFLGALGYQDENYENSIRIELMGKRPFDPKSILQGIPENKGMKSKDLQRSLEMRGGGSTGVSGGGDDEELKLKLVLYTWFEEKKKAELENPETMEKAQKELDAFLSIPVKYYYYQSAGSPPKIQHPLRDCKPWVYVGILYAKDPQGIYEFYEKMAKAAEITPNITEENLKNNVYNCYGEKLYEPFPFDWKKWGQETTASLKKIREDLEKREQAKK